MVIRMVMRMMFMVIRMMMMVDKENMSNGSNEKAKHNK